MKQPLISIVVPIYNAEKYIEQCLNSLINQTYSNLEIICINDGSTDNSGIILNEHASKDSRIRIIHNTNNGVSETRNIGIKIAKGEYLMFVDSDDWLEPTTCESTLSLLIEYNCDMILFPYIREYNEKSKKKIIFHKDKIIFNEYETKYKIQRSMIGPLEEELKYPENMDSLVTACGKLYKTAIVQDNNITFIDTKEIGTAEDALFNLNYLGYANKSLYINKYFYHYRRDNEESITTKYKPELFNQWNNLFDYMFKYIEDQNLDSQFSNALNNRISLSIIVLGLEEVNSKKNSRDKIKSLKRIINTPRYQNSIRTLSLHYFPLHWRLFFTVVKMNWAVGIYILLRFIEFLR